MKRWIPLLCILLLLTSAAYAEFDFTPYQLQGHKPHNSPLMLDEHTAVGVSYSATDSVLPRFITWWQDGQAVRELQLPDSLGMLWPQLGTDGTITWLYEADPTEPVDPEAWPRPHQLRGFQLTDDYAAHDFQLTDKLIHGVTRSQTGNFMYDEWIDGKLYVTIRSTSGETLLHRPLDFRKFSQMAYSNRYVYNDDGSCWLRVNDSGTAWMYLIEQPDQVSQICSVSGYPGIISDGKGGVFFCQSVGSGTYKPTQVTHYGRSGTNLGDVTISGNHVLVSFSIHPQADGSMQLYGHAVANSRKVYLAWRLLCDSELRPISDWDVREFNYHGDYGFGFVFSPSGTPYLFSNGNDDDPSVLVPFDVLPTAKNPGLTIR